MDRIAETCIEVCLSLIVIATLVPVAVEIFYSQDMSNAFAVYPGLETLWGLIPGNVIGKIVVAIISGAGLTYLIKR